MNGRYIYATLVALNLAAVAIAVAVGETSYTYFEEGRALTLLSFVQLFTCAALSAAVHRATGAAPSGIWLLMAAGFAYLGIDEWFEVHEKTDIAIHRLLGMVETPLSDRIDDAIVGLYVMVGGLALYRARAALEAYRAVRCTVAVIFALAAVSVALDGFTNGDGVLAHVMADQDRAAVWDRGLATVEETAKLLCEALTIGVLVSALTIARDRRGIAQSG